MTPAPATTLERAPAKGRSGSQVSDLQRARMLGALIEVVEQDGYAALTVGKVIARARVSRKTFYDIFANREDAFLAAFLQSTDRIRQLTTQAYAEQPDWRSGVRAALSRLLTFMDDEPGLACLCLCEALGAGETVLQARAELLSEAARAIDIGRSAAAKPNPPPLTAEAVVGGAMAILHNRFAREDHTSAIELLGALMSTIVLPYLGARAARAELTRPCPPAPNGATPAGVAPTREGDPLQGLNIRVTYRTVRTLMTIARNPGASNREVGHGAGISDQGQVSKLLNRLARLDLIENTGAGQSKGGANAWHLTPRGAYFEKAVRPH
ncbi:MAG: TetR family transcriptional regulator [Solirubrobacteraceae bacterium]